MELFKDAEIAVTNFLLIVVDSGMFSRSSPLGESKPY